MAELIDTSDSEEEFKINECYAANYNKWREKEELQKLKDKYGDFKSLASESKSSSSSSSESEEEFNDFTPDVEENFLKTLSLLKSNDPIIYDKNVNFFTVDEEKVLKPNYGKKKQPLFIKDYERELLLKENDGQDESNQQPQCSTYVKEQETIKKSFKTALNDSDDDDNLLMVREKTKEEENAEEAEFLCWLKGEKKHLSKNKEKEKNFKYLHDYWNDKKLDSSETYLKDYILNKRYIEKETDGNIPTYNEIIGDELELSDDEKVLEKQEMFEHKFNFRFEEPDPEFIKRYPRTMTDTLRKKDDKRKKKREEYKERKNQEKQQKKEELKRLKALKRKEIMEKLEKLQEITGNDKIEFDDDDIEGDFDPEKYDKKMKQLFNEDYYAVEDSKEKPTFPYDEEFENEDWDNWVRNEESAVPKNTLNPTDSTDALHCEDANFNMDADYSQENSLQQEMVQASRLTKRKRKSKFSEMLSNQKPMFNPNVQSFDQYLDEYYKLDYEDIIGNLPVRFSYREVVPNSFGLSVEEILTAKDKELNSWCTLKKTFQFRNKDEENYDVHAFKKKAENENLKKKILASLFEEEEISESNNLIEKPKKKRKKKQSTSDPRLKDTDSSNVEDKVSLLTEPSNKKCENYDESIKVAESIAQTPEVSVSPRKNKKKCKRKKKELGFLQDTCNTDVKVESGGFHSKKMKYENNLSESTNNETISNKKKETLKTQNQNFKNQKHKKTNKQPIFNEASNNSLSFSNKSSSKKDKQKDSRLSISNERLKAYGINPKKFKNKLLYSKIH